MENRRQIAFAGLLIGCLVALIGLKMSSTELGIGSGLIVGVIGFLMIIPSDRTIRVQEKIEFFKVQNKLTKLLSMKVTTGIFYVALGVAFGAITINIVGANLNTSIATIYILMAIYLVRVGLGKIIIYTAIIKLSSEYVSNFMEKIPTPREVYLKIMDFKKHQRVVA